MNHKKLIGAMLAVAVTAALCGRASGAAPQHTEGVTPEAAGELEAARNVWSECIRAAIPGLDRAESPSDAVGRAAMKRCSDQYTAMLAALSRTLVPTCDRDSDCTRAALAKAEREANRAATDEVVSARIRVAGAQVLICQ
jgi:hypothetical protein